MDSFIKLWRQTRDNEIFRKDFTAWHLFECILLSVDYKTGSLSWGRYQMGEMTDLNPETARSALVRLQKAKMVTTSSTNKFTIIRVTNWHKYQCPSPDTSPPASPSKHQQNTTIKEIKNIRSKEKNNIVEEIFDHYLSKFKKDKNRYKLTDKRKLKIEARLKDAGRDMLVSAITKTSESKFHCGDNDSGWRADLDFIMRSYEQVERLSQIEASVSDKEQTSVSDFIKSIGEK